MRVAFRQDSGYAYYNLQGKRDGYNVALVNRLALALDWNVEWVDVAWGETLAALEAGKLDVIPGPANVSPLRDRIEIGHVPIGYWRMCLYALSGSLLDCSDYQVFNGTVIGLARRHPANQILKSYLEDLGVKCVFREYDNRRELERALFTGEVGALFTEPTETLRYEKLLVALPSAPMYMGTSPVQRKLLDEIDRELAAISDGEPEFLADLHARYFRVERPLQMLLSPREIEWLGQQKREHRVFLVDQTPVDGLLKTRDARTGVAGGYAVSLLNEISDLVGLEFAVTDSEDSARAEQRLRSGEVEIALPYACGEQPLILDQDRDRVFSIPIPQAVCTRRFESVSIQRPETKIAVSRKDHPRLVAYRELGLSQQMVLCEDETSAIVAVATGLADCFVGDYPIVRGLVERQEHPEDFDIRIGHTFKYRPQFPLVVSPCADPILASVLSKSVHSITGDRLVQLADRYAADESRRRGLKLGDVVAVALPFAALVLGALVVILVVSRKKIRMHLRHSEESLRNAQAAMEESVRARGELKVALERAEEAANSKTSFLATMSHEIRTPLNAVIGYSEFLSDPDITHDKVLEYARGITLSANALLSLINDVLDIAKFESGRREGLDLRNGECDLKDLFAEMNTVFSLRCRNKGIGLEFRIASDFPRLVLAEPRFRQILLNLLGNAVKFTDQGGITVEALLQDAELTLTVRDTGIGISDRGKRQIFDPFAQDLESRRGKLYAGTGLGLSIVKRLVESSNGTITVDSEVGHGSCFTVKVPGMKIIEPPKPEPRAEEPAAEGEPAEKGPREIRSVVIVDDVPMNRKILSLHCKSLGLPEITVCESGQEVVEKLIGGLMPDVVLTDMWMPGMDGAQLSKAIKERWPSIPVVAVTADTDPGAKFDVSDFDAMLTKPVSGVKLRQLIDRLNQDLAAR